MAQQTDLFGYDSLQGELFDSRCAPVTQKLQVTPDSIREKMLAMLCELRVAEKMPWPERKLRINEVIFPQMGNWLPEEEAARLKSVFSQEIKRLNVVR